MIQCWHRRRFALRRTSGLRTKCKTPPKKSGACQSRSRRRIYHDSLSPSRRPDTYYRSAGSQTEGRNRSLDCPEGSGGAPARTFQLTIPTNWPFGNLLERNGVVGKARESRAGHQAILKIPEGGEFLIGRSPSARWRDARKRSATVQTQSTTGRHR